MSGTRNLTYPKLETVFLKLDQSTIHNLDLGLVLVMTLHMLRVKGKIAVLSNLFVRLSEPLHGAALNIELLAIQAHWQPLHLLLGFLNQHAPLVVFDNLAYDRRLIKCTC